MAEDTTYIHKYYLRAILLFPFAVAVGNLSQLFPRPWSVLISATGWFGVLACIVMSWIARRETKELNARVEQGRCVECGYDLRASKDRCPECGHAIEKVTDPS
jgi:hypothetical protein